MKPKSSKNTKQKNTNVTKQKKAAATEPNNSNTVMQAQKVIAELEDRSAAEYADTRTPGAPPKKTSKTKHKDKKVERSALEVETDIQESDINTIDGSDIERTVRKKQKGSVEARQAIQAMRKLPQIELQGIEEENLITDHGASDKDGEEVYDGKDDIPNRTVAGKGATIEATDSDIEMEGEPFPVVIHSLTYHLTFFSLDAQKVGIGKGVAKKDKQRVVSGAKRQHIDQKGTVCP